MTQVTRLAPLAIGRYDSNVFQSAAGIEHYRPLEGAAAGAESEVRRRPGIFELSFQMPQDQALLGRVIEAVFQTHSYQEPLIVVREVLGQPVEGAGSQGQSPSLVEYDRRLEEEVSFQCVIWPRHRI